MHRAQSALASVARSIPGGPFGRVVATAIVFDLCGFIFGVFGLQLAGSGVYQVVHSSVVVFSALFNLWFCGIGINQGQWGGIFIVAFGLALSALGSIGHGGRTHAGRAEHHRSALHAEIRQMQISAGVDPEDLVEETVSHNIPQAAGNNQSQQGDDSGTRVIEGVLLTLLGSALMAGNYVLIESLSRNKAKS